MKRGIISTLILLFAITSCGPEIVLPDRHVVKSGESLFTLTASYCQAPVEEWASVSMWRRWLKPNKVLLGQPGREYVDPAWGTVVRIYPNEVLAVPGNLCSPSLAWLWWLLGIVVLGAAGVFALLRRRRADWPGGRTQPRMRDLVT